MIIFRISAKLLNYFYGYEALNLLFKVAPSRMIIQILKQFGARIGDHVRIQAPFTIHNADKTKPIYQNLKIGNYSYIGRDCIIDLMGKVQIGARSTISHRVLLNTHTDTGNSPLRNRILKTSIGNIKIGEGAYIGSNVTLLENVVIGKNTIIGACSLVNKSILPDKKAYGVPCKIQEKLNDN